ncbi:MAG: sigma-70 family RNA polymerase sigma factor [Planctomycetes bacterium]|nr:sigma-70 family RNA polymerase sigma factor [Planctomycetota bacterium]
MSNTSRTRSFMALTAPSSSSSSTLLARVRQNDPEAWSRLCRIYAPSIYGWCRRAGLQDSDALDVGQEVFRTVARRIAAYRRTAPGDSFRGWLWGITRNKLKEHFRARPEAEASGGSAAARRLHELPEPPLEDSADVRVLGPQAALVRRVLAVIREDFDPQTFQAFWRTTVDEQPAPQVAAELNITPGAVRQAKHRVLRRLREELSELL